jgi:glycosyltransferase involved in cell wall biosynthesis
MRILWVKVGGLWPVDRGGRLRSFHLIKELSRRHELIVATTHEQDGERQGLAGALPDAEVRSVPYRIPKQGSLRFAAALGRSWASALPVDLWKARVPALGALASRLARPGQADACVADFLAAMPNTPGGGQVPRVLFQHNVEHVIWQRLAATERRAWRRALLGIEWRKMRRFEARACARAALTLGVSEADVALLARLAPRARLAALPTGVDAEYFAPTRAAERPAELVFLGSMDWYPNEDAVLHFIDRILPAIRREVPDASLTVVGRNPTPRLRAAAAASGVSITGTVDDVRPHVAPAAVCVVPLRVGGGTRLKIFEALAMEKAVVSTSVGAEGLPLTPGEHYRAADAPADFAQAVIRLLRDPEGRARLGRAGRALVEARFSWQTVARRFEEALETVTRSGGLTQQRGAGEQRWTAAARSSGEA